MWSTISGSEESGLIDVIALESWIKRARQLAKAAGRQDVAGNRIGVVLASSSVGEDGSWPAEPVRHMLDSFQSKPKPRGFWVGDT